MIKNLGTLFVSILVALALCEGMLRLAGNDLLPEPDLYRLDPDVGKRMRPNWEGREFGIDVRTNSRGLRNPEIGYERTPEKTRVLVLGDSLTFGYRLQEEQSYPRLLEGILNSARPDDPVEVINTGVVGYSTRQEAAFLRVEGVRYQPDVVLLAFYPVNDTHAKLRKYERYNRLREIHPWLLEIYTFPRKLVLREFIRGTRLMLKHKTASLRVSLSKQLGYVDQGAEDILEDDWTVGYRSGARGWQTAAAAIQEIGDLTRRIGARGMVVLLPDVQDLARYRDEFHGRVAPLVEAEAERAGLAFYDLEPVFRPYRGDEDRIRFPGERHPNAEGYRLIAAAIAKPLRKLIENAGKPGT
ncbi:MAG: hypothetical protein GY725_02415 [bacterium]|nr:hypothetical protein [bacterium]